MHSAELNDDNIPRHRANSNDVLNDMPESKSFSVLVFKIVL